MRRGYECCCQQCAKKSWCAKHPSKGRQVCGAVRRSADCLALIKARWCLACPLWAGAKDRFGPDEPPLPFDQTEAKPEPATSGKPVQP